MDNEKGWGVFVDEKYNNILHVYPMNEEHNEFIETGGLPPPICSCECQPRTQWFEESRSWLIVHDAFDGRQGVEWANELIKL